MYAPGGGFQVLGKSIPQDLVYAVWVQVEMPGKVEDLHAMAEYVENTIKSKLETAAFNAGSGSLVIDVKAAVTSYAYDPATGNTEVAALAVVTIKIPFTYDLIVPIKVD